MGDFNGDGIADLALGVAGEDLNPVDAGAVNVLYGAAAALSSANNQLWHQDSAGVLDATEANDLFAVSLPK